MVRFIACAWWFRPALLIKFRILVLGF
jgi:hypothetical protein